MIITLGEWLRQPPGAWGVWFTGATIISSYDSHYTVFSRKDGSTLARSLSRSALAQTLAAFQLTEAELGESYETEY